MEGTQYLWRGAPTASRAPAGPSTCNHTRALDTKQRTGTGAKALALTLKTPQGIQIFQLPNYKNEKRIWRDQLLDGLRVGSPHRNASEFIFYIHPLTRRVLNMCHEPRLRHTLRAALLRDVINQMKWKKDGIRVLLAEPNAWPDWNRARGGRETRVKCTRRSETRPPSATEPAFRSSPAALISSNYSSTHVLATS